MDLIASIAMNLSQASLYVTHFLLTFCFINFRSGKGKKATKQTTTRVCE